MVVGWFTSHLDVIGSVTTIVGSALVLVNSQLEKKHKWFAITGGVVVLFGGIMTFAASRMASHSQAIRQQQEVDRQQQILQNATAIDTQVSDAARKLRDLQSNLGDEKKAVNALTGHVKSGTKQVLEATKKVNDAITGGASYLAVTPMFVPVGAEQSFPLFAEIGKNCQKRMLQSVTIVMKQLPDTDFGTRKSLDDRLSGKTNDEVFRGNVIPRVAAPLMRRIKPSKSTETTYIIDVWAPNMVTVEHLRVRFEQKGQQWQYAYKIEQDMMDGGPEKPDTLKPLEMTSPEWRSWDIKLK